MLKKKIDIIHPSLDSDDKILISNIYDKLERSYLRQIPEYSDFLDNRQMGLVKNTFSFLKDEIKFDGGIKNSEWQLCYLALEYCSLPVNIIKISNLDKSKISHSDVLGSIMAHGIKRQKIGDIIISNEIFFAVKEEITSYILENLIKISTYNVKLEIATNNENIKRDYEFLDINTTVSSLRLDCVISSILNLSREKSKELILSGRVNLNHFEILDNRKLLSKNDVISIKKFGRFILSEINGQTKKDRTKILIKKFI
jgi:RNA-binding protein YlmH